MGRTRKLTEKGEQYEKQRLIHCKVYGKKHKPPVNHKCQLQETKEMESEMKEAELEEEPHSGEFKVAHHNVKPNPKWALLPKTGWIRVAY